MNTVGEEKFLAWYKATAKRPAAPAAALQRVYDSYFADGSEEFVLPAEETKSGAEARYAFRAECIGCCGAGTMYFYF